MGTAMPCSGAAGITWDSWDGSVAAPVFPCRALQPCWAWTPSTGGHTLAYLGNQEYQWLFQLSVMAADGASQALPKCFSFSHIM